MESKNERLEQFYVPPECMREFATLIQVYKFNNVIAGVENDDIVVFVDYPSSQQNIINVIHKMIDDYRKKVHENPLTEAEIFHVPENFISQFADLIKNHGFINSIVSRWPPKSIMVLVTYRITQRHIINGIQKKIKKYEKNQKDDKWKLNGMRC